MWKIKNTAFDRAKDHLHRTATRFDPEPYFNGRRIRNGQTMEITDELYERCKGMLKNFEAQGVFELTHVGGEPTTPEALVTKVEEAKTIQPPTADGLVPPDTRLNPKLEPFAPSETEKQPSEPPPEPQQDQPPPPADTTDEPSPEPEHTPKKGKKKGFF